MNFLWTGNWKLNNMFHENESGNDAMPSQPIKANRSAASPAKSATQDQLHRCSYCGESFKRSETKNMPFCSRRCQQIDLGMWLNESYGMPHEGEGAPDHDPDSDL